MREIRAFSDSDSPSESEIAALVNQEDALMPKFRRGIWAVGAGCALLMVAFLVTPSTTSQSDAGTTPTRSQIARSQIAPDTTQVTSPTNVAELLQSRQLAEVVGHVAVSAIETGANFQANNGTNTKLSPAMKLHAQDSAAKQLASTVQQLFSADPHAAAHLRNTHITAEQGNLLLKTAHAMADPRVLDVGLEIGHACHSHSSTALEICAMRHFAEHATKMRTLHEELVPAPLRNLNVNVKSKHMSLLAQHGVLQAAGDVGGWHAQVSVQKSRMLQG